MKLSKGVIYYYYKDIIQLIEHSEGAREYQKMKRMIERKLKLTRDFYKLILVSITYLE